MSNADLVTIISRSDDACCNAILRMQERQTLGEQTTGTTSESNGQGWNAIHAPFMTSLARQIMENKGRREMGVLPEGYGLLSRKQLDAARKILPIYITQLQAIAAERTAPQMEETPAPLSAECQYCAETECDCDPEEHLARYEMDETPAEFARTTVDPQTARIERAKQEGRLYQWRVAGPESWEVQTTSGSFYQLTLSSCSCKDSEQNPELRCKHRCALEVRLMEEADRTGKPVVLRVLSTEYEAALGRMEYTYHPLTEKPARRRKAA